MSYSPLLQHNIMEMWAFETCNFRCGYCSLVTSGAVTKGEQLDQFRDESYIDRLVSFFANNRPGNRPWAVIVTGGEPFLMPNLERFVRGLGEQGDCAAFYTNNSVRVDKVLSDEACRHLSYVQCSFHPDWHMGKFERDTFFSNAKMLVDRGVPTLVRFVGAPQVMHLLPELEEKSLAIGAGFLPTTLFGPDYPRSYSDEVRAELAGAMSGFSSLLQLEGGVIARDRLCDAGARLFAVRLHQGGDITPCISTASPVFGNILQGTLHAREGAGHCYKEDSLCTCDIHFQQHVVHGVDDSVAFAQTLSGKRVYSIRDFDEWKRSNGIVTSDRTYAGQGVAIVDTKDLLRKAPKRK